MNSIRIFLLFRVFVLLCIYKVNTSLKLLRTNPKPTPKTPLKFFTLFF